MLEVSDTTPGSQLGGRIVRSLVLPASWALVEDFVGDDGGGYVEERTFPIFNTPGKWEA